MEGGRDGIEEGDDEQIKRIGACLRDVVDAGGRGRVLGHAMGLRKCARQPWAGAGGRGSSRVMLASIERPPLTLNLPFPLRPPFLIPSQSKNHTNRNQSFKAHRNGIKKPKNYVSKSLKGVSVVGMISILLLFLFSIHTSAWIVVQICLD